MKATYCFRGLRTVLEQGPLEFALNAELAKAKIYLYHSSKIAIARPR